VVPDQVEVVAGAGLGALSRFIEKGLQVLADHLVEDRLLRLSAAPGSRS
jgi:hypothetical protein